MVLTTESFIENTIFDMHKWHYFHPPKRGIRQAAVLNLNMNFEKEHVRWKYQPRSKKGVLPFTSADLKFVKRGRVSSLMIASLDKSCKHVISESISDQAGRLCEIPMACRMV